MLEHVQSEIRLSLCSLFSVLHTMAHVISIHVCVYLCFSVFVCVRASFLVCTFLKGAWSP